MGRGANIRIIRFDERKASQAYRAYQAIWEKERDDASLSDNPAWVMLREEAFTNFAMAFGGLPE